jgi:hypothetical protein
MADGDGAAGGPLDAAAVQQLIDATVGNLRDSAEEQRVRNEELHKRNEEADKVIAAQAKELQELRESQAKEKAAPKEYCQYGSDGRGRGNPYPRRDVENEPELETPHFFDVSTDPGYLRCVGKFGIYRHEYRSLAAFGSHLHDFRAEVEPSLAELRGSADPGLVAEGARLTNTLDGVLDLIGTRFGYLLERTRPGANKYELEALEKKLYSREGVRAPSSSLDKHRAAVESAQDTATYKLLAQLAAKEAVKDGAGAGDKNPKNFPKPR